jgi:predicted transcriptional regulator
MLRIIRIAVFLIAFSAIIGIVAASDGGHDREGDHGNDSTAGSESGSSLKVHDNSGHQSDPLSVSRDSGSKGDSASGKDSSDRSADPEAHKKGSTGSSSDGGVSETSSSTHGQGQVKETSREDQRGVRSSDNRVKTEKVAEKEVSGEHSERNSDVRGKQNHDNELPEKSMTVYRVSGELSKKNTGGLGSEKWDRVMSSTLTSPTQNPDTPKQERRGTKSPVDQYPKGEIPYAIPAIPNASGSLPLISSAPAPRGASPLALRSKMKGEQKPFWNKTDSSLILSPFMLLKIWFFLGFRRVERKNILDHDERNNLYQNIEEYPGVDLTRLVNMLGLNKETARYHIKMLSLNGKISGLIKQGIARYFPTREGISEYEKIVIHYLWIGTTKRILLLLLDSPGLTRQAIAENLGITGPSVTWQMQRLAEDGLVEIRNVGKFVMYFLTKDGVETLQSMKTKHSMGIIS